MTHDVGILAYGSLIDNPGPEIGVATIATLTEGIVTPFCVEFARTSQGRAGAPTLVPVQEGGASVTARIFVLNVEESEATDRLYRREINAVGTSKRYRSKPHPGMNDVVVQELEWFHDVRAVFYTQIGANIEDLSATKLANLAVASAKKLRDGRDGISYLIAAKVNGIRTALSDDYEREILRLTGTACLEAALAACTGTVTSR